MLSCKFSDSMFTLFQALAHKTLVLLLGVDPSKQLDHPLPTAHPHVTYAYMKYMWKSSRKVRADSIKSIAQFILIKDFFFQQQRSGKSIFQPLLQQFAVKLRHPATFVFYSHGVHRVEHA